MSKDALTPPTSRGKSGYYDEMLKIVLSGNSSVGKTMLLSRFVSNEFSDDSTPTIGVEFATRIIELNDGQFIKAQVWDTAGQERYSAITHAYYRGALGALLVFDLSERRSFTNLLHWLEELREHSSSALAVTLCGNKSDVKQRRVTRDEAEAFAAEHDVVYLETSAKTGENVDAAFENVLERARVAAFSRRSSHTTVASPQAGSQASAAAAAQCRNVTLQHDTSDTSSSNCLCG